MIAYLKGRVLAMTAESAIIENNGVGYEVFCSGAAFAAMQNDRREAELFTYLQVKDDGLTLYGFFSLAEKQVFLDLISVSGVGPKLAIAVLTGMRAEDVAASIAAADVKRLSSVKGLGKRTAEKIVLELHGKVSAEELLAANDENAPKAQKADPMSEIEEEAMSALAGLGFTRNECVNAIKRAHEKGAKELEDIIRTALSGM